MPMHSNDTAITLFDTAPGFARVRVGQRSIGSVRKPDFRILWNVKLADGTLIGQASTRKAAVDLLVNRCAPRV